MVLEIALTPKICVLIEPSQEPAVSPSPAPSRLCEGTAGLGAVISLNQKVLKKQEGFKPSPGNKPRPPGAAETRQL